MWLMLSIMDNMPGTPDPQTRTEVTRRIIAHVTRGWPRLGEPIVRHRGRFCYVSALLPGHHDLTPILRLRYQGSADRWAIGIYLASSGQYTESELPASFGPKTGTPEEAVDDTFILYAGPKSGRLRRPTKVRNTSLLSPLQKIMTRQIDPLCAETANQGRCAAAAPNGGSARVLRDFRGHSACCRPPTPMPVDPALTAL
jgi:hypothetical protein